MTIDLTDRLRQQPTIGRHRRNEPPAPGDLPGQLPTGTFSRVDVGPARPTWWQTLTNLVWRLRRPAGR